jgi:hypothetical protein
MAKKSKYYDDEPTTGEVAEETEGMDVTPAPSDPNATEPLTGPHHLGGAYAGDISVPAGGNTPGVHPPSVIGTSHAVPAETDGNEE